MKTLTKAEEQVMQAVWKVKEGFIRDIMETLPPTQAPPEHGSYHIEDPGGKGICGRNRHWPAAPVPSAYQQEGLF